MLYLDIHLRMRIEKGATQSLVLDNTVFHNEQLHF